MKRRFLILSLLSCVMFIMQPRVSFAQFFQDFSTIGSSTIQLTAGSQGLGLDYRYGISETLTARLGASFLPVSMDNAFHTSSGGVTSTNDVAAKFNNAHLFADYTPFEGAPWLRFVAGAGYLFKATGIVNMNPYGTYRYGSIVLNNDQIGNININVSWKGFAPYVGFGFLRGVPTENFNINLDLGAYYLASPSSTVTGAGLLSSNGAQQAAQITQNMKSYRILPVLQLNFNFRIN